MGGSSPLLVDMRTNSFYSLVENKVVSLGGGNIGGDGGDSIRIVGSSHGWLAFLTEECLDLFLWNPVSGRSVDLPSIHSLNLSAYDLESGYGSVRKLIVSSASPDDADCRAILFYGTYRLAFCCPGRSGAEWISIGSWYFDNGKFDREYADFVFSTRQNRLFCITNDSGFFDSDLERWDLEDPFSPRIDGSNSKEPELDEPELEEFESKLDEPESEDERNNSAEPELEESESEVDEPERDDGRTSYLVLADDDQVFIVVRKIHIGTLYAKNGTDLGKTIDFDVYKVFEGEDGQLTTPHVDSLDGLSMFVGINECFALSAAQFPELKPNSIYFTNPTEWHPDTLTWWSSSYGIGRYRYDIGIFDYQNEIFYSCYSRLEAIEEASPEGGEEEASPLEEGGEDEEGEGDEDEDGIIFELLPLIVWFRPNYVASEF